ncbi:origin recognition complex subunit 2 [Arctopsyche grandis]|uniref:origin recognition complex subunit 2 n=1 Tax=Arctopsyche grandis TaxID=121162 RepID=UPI00406D7381
MEARARRSVSRPCYKESDSFIEDISLTSPPTEYALPSRKVAQVNDTDSSSDQNQSQFKIVSNEYPKIVIDVSNKLNRTPVTPRRGNRPRRKSAVFKEAEEATTKLKKLTVGSNIDDEDSDNAITEKATALFTEDDVEGQKIFGFKKMHRKQNLLKKAIESVLDTPKKNDLCNSPRTPKSALKVLNSATPKSNKRVSIHTSTKNFTPKSLKFNDNQEKTPRNVRRKLQQRLEAAVESENSDFSASDSEFCPSEESSDSDNASEDDDVHSSESSQSESEQNQSKKKKVNVKTPSKSYSLRTRGEKDPNFIMKSDDYFTMHGNKKIVTSNHTLERLKNPRLTEEKLHYILKNQSISKEHKSAIQELLDDHKKLFDKWLYFLSEGFNILLYGVGSKEKLIQEFQIKKLSTHPCIVINGFFPSLTLKDILESIAIDLLGLNSIPANIYEAVDLIRNEILEYSDENFFLLIHNLDGALLRNQKAQHVVSKLAKIKNVHLIASIDHINAPLFWDHAKLSDYNFSWWDTTTLLPYRQETSYENSLLVHKSGALALSSLKNVFNSLTTNAKGIFMLIVKNQLKNLKTSHYQGIPFKDLYWTARESFLVSSDLALRAQLTEFLDHKLVKNKRNVDGTENLIIPIDNVLLQQFNEQNEE